MNRAAPVPLPPAPAYGVASLPDLLPSVAASLGVDPAALPVRPALDLPPAARACVLLVDGLGDVQLRDRAGHAPYLRSRLDEASTLSAGFPTTTATSMGGLGTGLPPGGHGLVGYEVLVPERDELLNELSWEPRVDPRRWQPAPTVLQAVAAAGVDVVRIGPGFFDGSGLTEAALRGGRFVAAESLEARVQAALAALRSSPRCLVYVYWGEVDKVGHVHGAGSWQWGEELGRIDLAVRELAAGLPRDAVLHVTADHGMVDVPHSARLDLAHEPDLAAGVRHAGGEARSLHLYCEPDQAEAVLTRWRERLGDSMWLLTRDEAVSAGWFGPVAEHVRARIGDVLAVAHEPVAVVDSRRQRPELLALIGLHGALTEAEARVPLISVGPNGSR